MYRAYRRLGRPQEVGSAGPGRDVGYLPRLAERAASVNLTDTELALLIAHAEEIADSTPSMLADSFVDEHIYLAEEDEELRQEGR